MWELSQLLNEVVSLLASHIANSPRRDERNNTRSTILAVDMCHSNKPLSTLGRLFGFCWTRFLLQVEELDPHSGEQMAVVMRRSDGLSKGPNHTQLDWIVSKLPSQNEQKDPCQILVIIWHSKWRSQDLKQGLEIILNGSKCSLNEIWHCCFFIVCCQMLVQIQDLLDPVFSRLTVLIPLPHSTRVSHVALDPVAEGKAQQLQLGLWFAQTQPLRAGWGWSQTAFSTKATEQPNLEKKGKNAQKLEILRELCANWCRQVTLMTKARSNKKKFAVCKPCFSNACSWKH